MARIEPSHRFGALAAIAAPFLLAAALAGCVDGGLKFEALFPVANQHPAGFAARHGRVVLMAGGPDKAKVDNGMTCVMCHATEKNPDGSLPTSSRGSKVTCLQCHKGGPDGNPGHPADFRSTHGDLVLAAGSAEEAKFEGITCSTCHAVARAADGSIPASKASRAKDCFACHQGGPSGSPAHPSDWIATHGDTVLAEGGVQTATFGGVTCTSCHAAARDPGGNVVRSPEKRAEGVDCFKCHQGGPTGDPAHPANYVLSHGPDVRVAGGPDKAKFGGWTCTTCHAASKDASGQVVPSPQKKAKDKTCYTCHPGGPDGSPHAGGTGWLAAHGDVVVAAGGYTLATENTLQGPKTCGTCHSTEKIDGVVPPSPRATSTCYTCHAGGPSGSPAHPDKWTIEGHGAFVKAAGGLQSAKVGGLGCAACHTTQRATDGSIPPSPHSGAKSCFVCHVSGPPER